MIHDSKPGPDARDTRGCEKLKDSIHHHFCLFNAVGDDKKPSKFYLHFDEMELIRDKLNSLISTVADVVDCVPEHYWIVPL